MKSLGFKVFTFVFVYVSYIVCQNFTQFYVLEPYFTIALTIIFLTWMILGYLQDNKKSQK